MPEVCGVPGASPVGRGQDGGRVAADDPAVEDVGKGDVPERHRRLVDLGPGRAAVGGGDDGADPGAVTLLDVALGPAVSCVWEGHTI